MSENVNDASSVSIYEEIFPGDTNPFGTAFGGKILALMDRSAGLAAARFAHCHFVTVSLDSLDFRAPVQQGEIAEIRSKVVYTSKRTAGIKVEVFAVEKTKWEPRKCCQGVIFMVAMGEDGKPAPVPEFRPEGEGEKADWDYVASIHREMLSRKHSE